MTTKFKIYFPLAITALLGVLAGGCEKEDNTGYSTLNPTKPTITVTPLFTNPASLVEQDSTFEYSVTLSEVQLVDVKLKVAQVGGTASASDYSMTEEIYINAGSTSAKGKIKILPDADIEETETLTIQVGDNEVANAVFAPVTFEFSILNVTSNALEVDLTWDSDVLSSIGIDDDATDVANFSIKILKESDLSTLAIVESDGYKAYNGWDTLPNGKYTIASEFLSNKNYGDAHSVITFGLHLDFKQVGIQFESMSFPSIVTDEFNCATAYLANVTVNNGVYTFEEIGEKYIPFESDGLDGVHAGIDRVGVRDWAQNFTIQNATIDSLEIWGMFDRTLNSWGVKVDSAYAKLYFDEKGKIAAYQDFYCENNEGDPNGNWVYYIDLYEESYWNPCTKQLYLYYDIIWLDPSTGYATYGWMYGSAQLAIVDLSGKKAALVSNNHNEPIVEVNKGLNGRVFTSGKFVK